MACFDSAETCVWEPVQGTHFSVEEFLPRQGELSELLHFFRYFQHFSTNTVAAQERLFTAQRFEVPAWSTSHTDRLTGLGKWSVVDLQCYIYIIYIYWKDSRYSYWDAKASQGLFFLLGADPCFGLNSEQTHVRRLSFKGSCAGKMFLGCTRGSDSDCVVLKDVSEMFVMIAYDV